MLGLSSLFGIPWTEQLQCLHTEQEGVKATIEEDGHLELRSETLFIASECNSSRLLARSPSSEWLCPCSLDIHGAFAIPRTYIFKHTHDLWFKAGQLPDLLANFLGERSEARQVRSRMKRRRVDLRRFSICK